MPEFHNIEAYMSLKTRSFADAVDAYRGCLSALDLLTPAVADWLAAMRWEVADNGFVYGPPRVWHDVQCGSTTLRIAPFCMGWTQDVVPELDANCLEVGLLLETERLSNSGDWRYRPEVGPTLLKLVHGFLPVAERAPVVLTDEAQDGRAWTARLEGKGDVWCFDLAIARDGVMPEAPETIRSHPIDGAVAYACAEAWTSLPWV